MAEPGISNGASTPEDSSPLDRIAIDDALTTGEGVSVDYLFAAKITYLTAQNRTLAQQTQFADAKAATLVTLMGVLAVNSAVIAPNNGGAFTAIDFLFWTLMAACLGLALWAIVPRYPGAVDRDRIAAGERFSWPALSADTLTPDAYARFMRDSQASHLLVSLARSNAVMARILLRKFRALRVAFQVAAVAVAVLLIRAGGGL